MISELLTISEVAEKLQVSEKTVRNWVEAGKLEAFRFGQAYRIRTEDFDNFVEASRVNKDN